MHINIRWAAFLTSLLLLISLSGCDAAKILALFPMTGTSHMILNSALAKELAQRGHQVTVVSIYPQEKPIANYTDIVVHKITIEELLSSSISKPTSAFEIQNLGYMVSVDVLCEFGKLTCERNLQHPEVQKLIHSKDEEFDLIILDAFYIDCFMGFAHKFKAPVIQICAFGGTEVLGDLVGNPFPYSYVPDPYREFGHKMSFKERLLNTLGLIYQQLRKMYYLPIQDALMKKYFNYTDDLPSISELEKYVSMIFVNHHFSIGYPRPLMPNQVQIGGAHVKPPKALPADLKKFIDEAEHGVIYFSMGSNFRSNLMHNGTLEALLGAFSKLKQKVLWKWESDSLPGKPENVKVGKWLPQSDILAHPNIRMFITHGGLLSTLETIIRGVPVIGIPVFGDQKLNMARAEASGFGIKLEYADITSESVISAIEEMLGNPRYRENVQRMSQIFRDQPLTPMEQAVFWTEYVIRHKGAPHMRSAALDLAWYQYYLLDVIAVLLLAIGSVLLIVFLTIRTVFRFVCGGSKGKVDKSSKKKKE